ncbi:MurR/RpiR family transcriptional regulator [Massilioclostridium coli]|uniref:MurR/RpiR family transcriptional regulator n=1 Tax=Massilioclostridium coli TaxID=1870991 RepID=UPI0022E61750|nr:MurR/RpiR family transcriptional regulator [Massilioclostridium coli]
MEKDLLELIELNMGSFSKGQKLIANYILNHYDKAAFMTAAKLGATVGVSESTVVRFATEIGFDGYPKLQKALHEMIRNRLTSVQRIQVTDEQIGQDDVLDKVLNLDIEKIRKTLEETSRKDFEQAVDSIVNAETIYIIGTRSAAPLASFMWFYFNQMFKHVRLVQTTSVSEMFEQIMRIEPQDVLIGISFPRYSNNTVKAFRYAKDCGGTVVAITDSPKSPLAKKADSLLLARSDMVSFIDSLVAPLSLVNALVVAVGLKKREEISTTYQKLEYIWDEYQVYAKNREKMENKDI